MTLAQIGSYAAWEHDHVVVHVSGELDLSTAPQLHEWLHPFTHAHPAAELVLDLSGVTFIDCGGLRPLLETRNQWADRLTVRQMSRAVRRLLELADLTDAFPPHERADRVLASPRQDKPGEGVDAPADGLEPSTSRLTAGHSAN